MIKPILGICTVLYIISPSGWHIPTDAEWTILTTYLGGVNVAGGKLKETGNSHWNSQNTGATNETSFTGLPGGCRHFNGFFIESGKIGYWWSATEYSSDLAWGWFLYNVYNNVDRDYLNQKVFGYSVRCVMD